MGCSASKPVADVNKPAELQINATPKVYVKEEPVLDTNSYKANVSPFIQITNDKCPHIRLDHCKEPKKLSIEGATYKYTSKYCYVSQRGYYPNAMGKANQDSYLVGESILGDKSCNIYGIFDGHGEYGDFCSYFCAESFTGNLVKELDDLGGVKALDGPKMEAIYTKAYVKTNSTMNKSNIDDTLSGTTGVTILQRGDKLLIGNVGDSRAIIASSVDGKLKYSPLSNDQTPYRKDERERLKKLVRTFAVCLLRTYEY